MKANLMGNVRPCVTNISIHLPHNSYMLVAIQERVFLVSQITSPTAMRCFVCLKTRIGQNHNQSLRVLIVGRYWDVLLGDKLW